MKSLTRHGLTRCGMSRRDFIGNGLASAGVAAIGWPSLANAQPGPIVLEARQGRQQLLDAGEPMTDILGFGGRTPGPTIRVQQGEEVHARLVNGLDEETTIHWHGIRIDNRMDGVAHLTQPAVKPGETFDYRFKVPDAGTFWYHPHAHRAMQQDRGLYGLLIVEERQRVAVDREIAVVIDDWRLEDSGAIETRSLSSLHDAAHAGRLGNVLTVNGQPFGRIPCRSGERLRVRVCSPCNARILDLAFEGVAAQLVAVDGQPLEPEPLADGRLILPPSGRADLIVDITGKPGTRATLAEVTGERVAVARFEVADGAPVRERPREDTVRLPANPVGEPRIDNEAFRFDLAMTGGAMGRMDGAVYEGKYRPIRELAQVHRMVWAFNGVSDGHGKPIFTVRRGRTVVIRLLNETMWPHAMHVHGHHFRVVSRSHGKPKPWLHDTVLMQPREEMTIALQADNPGKWMLHCHMLEHQMSGMSSWFEVET